LRLLLQNVKGLTFLGHTVHILPYTSLKCRAQFVPGPLRNVVENITTENDESRPEITLSEYMNYSRSGTASLSISLESLHCKIPTKTRDFVLYKQRPIDAKDTPRISACIIPSFAVGVPGIVN